MNVGKTILFLVILAAVAVIVWVLARDYKEFELEVKQDMDTWSWKEAATAQEAAEAKAKKKQLALMKQQLTHWRDSRTGYMGGGKDMYEQVMRGHTMHGNIPEGNEELAVMVGRIYDKMNANKVPEEFSRHEAHRFAYLVGNGLATPDEALKIVEVNIKAALEDAAKAAKVANVLKQLVMGFASSVPVAGQFIGGAVTGFTWIGQMAAGDTEKAHETFFWSWINNLTGKAMAQGVGAIKG